ncbi:adenine deaminase [Methanothermococcus okinawensis]|uniref:Adenine deaminase n=1 Tax=Methanothermococcus okinawensis (strain DSM 14208 / JCM 11175 / IH1) TaxID=647113 RepID=F8AKD5_METOI|nr:adenine deaminase [Methanothermococcus okinawensis]AEH06335.1 Adenine deaminase [Methanothermococcus okinawensis IH1]
MVLILKDANIINVYTGEILKGNIGIKGDKIDFVDYYDTINLNNFKNAHIINLNGKFITPTFIDGHIHIESSHIIPSEFEKYALLNGVSKVVIDPHEIVNVKGIEGIKFMLNDARILDVYCMVPSCVPASELETSGTRITSKVIENIFKDETYKNKILGLGEVMNYIGVINENSELLKKINITKKYKKLIDGHAPQLTGLDLNKYIGMGIMSDHECTSEKEALEKIRLGLKLMVREGTASKNIDILKIRDKLNDIRNIMLVSDDISIKDLKNGYIVNTLKKATRYVSPVEAIQMVTINPANYFGFDVGIKPSNNADLIIFEDLTDFKINKVMIRGKFLEEYDLFKKGAPHYINYTNNHKNIKYDYLKYNSMNYSYKSEKDFLIEGIDIDIKPKKSARVINPIKNSLITQENILKVSETVDKLNKNKLNRIYVIERHKGTNRIGKGLIHLLKKGTIASSYAHDSHNVVVVGNNLKDISIAVNHLKDINGGFVAVENGKILESVRLNIAGIMGDDGEYIYEKIESITKKTKHYAIYNNEDLFLTLSFLTLSVIPELKITDFGLVKDNKIVDLVF